MVKSRSCWEFKKCGREVGGARADELGVCPAAVATEENGVNSGVNGGRCCWAIAGTLCGGRVQGTFATKLATCLECDFYVRVCIEEGASFVGAKQCLDRVYG